MDNMKGVIIYMLQLRKEVIAVITSIVMVIVLLPCGSMAADTEKLVFDLELSGYETTSTVKNAVSGSNSTITVGGTSKPGFGTLDNGTKYVSFDESSKEGGAPESYIEVADSSFLNQNKLTIETWVRPRNYTAQSSDMLFQLYSDDTANVRYWDMYRYKNSWIRHRPSGNAEGDEGIKVSGVIDSNQNKWTHMVFTRTWVPDEDDQTQGTWQSSFYINGQRVDTDTPVEQTRVTEVDTSKLLIGNGSKWSEDYSFIGDMATFKVYQTALSHSEITSKYEESCVSFAPDDEQPDDEQPDVGEPDDEEPIGIIAEEDFTKYAVGTHPDTEMYVSSADEPGNNIDITVKQAENTDKTKTIKYFSIGVDNYSSDTLYGYKFPTPVNYDFAFDTNIRLKKTAQSRGIRCAISSNSATTVHHMLESTINAKTDDFGFYNLRYIFTVGDDGKYTVTWYDLLDGEKKIGSTSTEFSTISAIVFQQWVAKTSVNSGIYIDVSKYKLMKYRSPKVVSTDGSSLGRGVETLTFVLSEEIDENTITPESIKLIKSGTDEEVSITFEEYEADTKTITIGLNEYLPYDTSFDICLSGIRNMSGFLVSEDNKHTFKTKAPEVTISEFAFLSSTGSGIDSLYSNANVSVKIKAKNVGEDSNSLKVFLVLYNETGVVMEIKEKTVILSATDTDITLSLTDDIAPKEGYSVKCFAWQKNTQNQIPVFGEIKLLK